jgi:hypothetical protein
VELSSAEAALAREDAFGSLAWDVSVLAEVVIAVVNPDGTDREKSRACWPRVEIWSLKAIASWGLD